MIFISLNMEKPSKSRIDMRHGFMKSIIRNQVERDNYDKEVRAIKSEEKNNIRRDNKQHPRKPDIPMYIPPCRLDNVNSEQEETVEQDRHDDSDDDRPVQLFIFEFEDKDGKVYKQYIQEGVDAEVLARRMGYDRKLPANMVKALESRLQEEIDKRLGPS